MSHALLLLCNRCLDHFNLFCPLKYSPSSWIYFWAGQSIFGSTVQTLQRGHHSDNDKQEIQGHFLNCLPFQIDDIWAWQTEHSCRRVCVCVCVANLVNTKNIVWPCLFLTLNLRSQHVPCELVQYKEYSKINVICAFSRGNRAVWTQERSRVNFIKKNSEQIKELIQYSPHKNGNPVPPTYVW